MKDEDIRRTVLEVVQEFGTVKNSILQAGTVIQHSVQRLDIPPHDLDSQQALLAFFGDLFRTGYLAWGYNIANPSPPFCHITQRGRQALSKLGRDPTNPDGYIHHLKTIGTMNGITEAYIKEALRTYNAGCEKATTVMVGVATESIVLELRDELVKKLAEVGQSVPKNLNDWKIKTVLDAMNKTILSKKETLPKNLTDSFEAHWPAFTQQIRVARNEAGHPASIGAVGEEAGHTSLLIFPELLKLSVRLTNWIKQHLT